MAEQIGEGHRKGDPRAELMILADPIKESAVYLGDAARSPSRISAAAVVALVACRHGPQERGGGSSGGAILLIWPRAGYVDFSRHGW